MARLEVAGLVMEVPDGQLPDKLGIEITDGNPDRLVATMPVAGNLQPYGLLHGGATCVLAETLGSVAAAMHAGRERVAVGLDLHATHHRAARSGTVTAVCTPLHRGGTVATFEIVVTDDSEQRICTVRLTCLIRSKPPAQPGDPGAELRDGGVRGAEPS